MAFATVRVTIQTTKNTSDAARAAFGVFCLTTVYPTDTLGAHGNSGGKSAGKDVFPSGKGRKWLETSGNRHSQILWEQDAARQIFHSFQIVQRRVSPFLLFFACVNLSFLQLNCRNSADDFLLFFKIVWVTLKMM